MGRTDGQICVYRMQRTVVNIEYGLTRWRRWHRDIYVPINIKTSCLFWLVEARAHNCDRNIRGQDTRIKNRKSIIKPLIYKLERFDLVVGTNVGFTYSNNKMRRRKKTCSFHFHIDICVYRQLVRHGGKRQKWRTKQKPRR